MIYVFKCKNEKCKNYNEQIEIEQRMNDEHEADCQMCRQPMKRIFTPFSIGVPQGNITSGGVTIPAKRAREIERQREAKKKRGGEGAYHDNPNRRLANK